MTPDHQQQPAPSDAEREALTEGAHGRAPRKRRRRRLLLGAGAVVLLLIVVVVAAPLIAAPIAASRIEHTVAQQTGGEVEVGGVRLWWTGAQRVDGLRVIDAGGDERTNLDIEVRRGLLGLAGDALAGRYHLGTVRLRGFTTLVRAADGPPTLAPPPAGNAETAAQTNAGDRGGRKSAGSGGGVPESLRFELIADGLEVRLLDPAVGPVTATASLLRASALDGGVSIESVISFDRGGHIRVEGQAPGVLAKLNTPGLDPLTIEGSGTVDAESVPTALLSAVAAAAGIDTPTTERLLEAFGSQVSLRVSIAGDGRVAVAQTRLRTRGVESDLQLDLSSDLATAQGEIRLRSEPLLALAGDIRARLTEAQTARIAAWPDAVVRVERARVPRARGTVETDAAAFDIAIELTDLLGEYTESDGSVTPVRVQPGVIRLSSAALGRGVQVVADASVWRNGNPAGQAAIDAAVSGLFEDGELADLSARLPLFRGELTLTGVGMAAVDPFVEQFDLTSLLGPTLELALQGSSDENDPAAAIVTLEATSAQAVLRGRARVDASGVEGLPGDDGAVLTARLGNVAPLLAGVLPGEAPITIDRADAAVVRIDRFALDLDRWGAGDTPDLRALSVAGAGEMGGISAIIAGVSGAERLTTEPLRFSASFNGGPPGGTLNASFSGAGAANGQRFTLSGEASAPGVLDDQGRLLPGELARLARAEAVITDLPTSLVQALAKPERLDLIESVGPAIDITLSMAGATGEGDSPLTLTARAARLEAAITALASPAGITLSGEGVRVYSTGVAPVLAAFAPEDGNLRYSARDDAFVRLTLGQGRLPLQDSFDPERLFLGAGRVVIDGVRVSRRDEPSVNAALSAGLNFTLQDNAFNLADGSLVRLVGPGGRADIGLAAQVDDLLGSPSGTVRVSAPEVPSAMLSLLAAPPPPAEPGMPAPADPVEQLTAAFGPTLALQIDARGALEPTQTEGAAAAPRGRAEFALTAQGADVQGSGAITPDRALTIDAEVRRLATSGLGGLAGGLALDELLGPDLRAELSFDGRLGDPPAGPDATPGPLTGRLRVNATAARLRMPAPAELVLGPDRVRLAGPVELGLTAPEGFVNQVLAPEPGAARTLTATAPIDMTLALRRFSIPRGAEPGAVLPEIDAELRVPAVNLAARETAPIDWQNLRLVAQTRGEVVRVSATASSPDGGMPIRLSGELQDAFASGSFSLDTARFTGTYALTTFPVPVADAIAQANGQLTGLLGPTADATGVITDMPAVGGTLTVNAQTPTSTLDYSGRVIARANDGAMLADRAIESTAPVTVRVFELSDRYGFDVSSLAPQFQSVAKSREQEPATVMLERLVIPLDFDPESYTVEGDVDPGVFSYRIGGPLAAVLKPLNAQQQDAVLERFEPFRVTGADGDYRYLGLVLKLGEFRIESRGQFNLNRGYEEFVLFVPAGALAREAIGGDALGGILGGVVQAVRFPIRLRRPIDEEGGSFAIVGPRIESDLIGPEDRFLPGENRRENGGGGNALDDIINRGLNEILRRR